jgi:hypothetical protein
MVGRVGLVGGLMLKRKRLLMILLRSRVIVDLVGIVCLRIIKSGSGD